MAVSHFLRAAGWGHCPDVRAWELILNEPGTVDPTRPLLVIARPQRQAGRRVCNARGDALSRGLKDKL
ncbi:MAG: hypothetical protein JSS05_04210 [Proteobacteria bacterium]|nr:hypothetical protein [Pseudomonadota bacterium]